jgi:RNA-directed DNA polymerase
MHNSNSSMNPDRGGVGWRDDKMPALDNLMERILLRENMQQAWQRVRSNQGALGSDGMRLEDFPAYAGEPWSEIRQSLREGRYQPRPVRRVVIPKPHGKGERKLGVPCVIDRVIQQAILQVLTPLFDPDFSEFSFGCRPKRSAHGAIRQVKTVVNAGHRIVVDLDLEKCFDWTS